MNLRNRYISLALVALLGQSSQAKEEDNLPKNLRKGKDKDRDVDTADLLPLGSSPSVRRSKKAERFVVRCDEGQDKDECLGEILSALPDKKTKVLHRLKKENAYAVAVKDMNPSDMKKLRFDSWEDPVREPLHIKDSLEIHRELQFFQQRVPYGIDMVKAQEAWDKFGVRGENAKVCVLDTGVRRSHDDFDPSKLSGYDGDEAVTPWSNDRQGHGTHVTGTIAASDNNKGVVGVAPEVEIYTVRVFDNDGEFFGSDVIAAAEACQDAGANIINMSLGGAGGSNLERRTFENLYDDGIIAVAAAGNSGGTDFLYPASYEVVLSVAAVDSDRKLARFSTRNNRVDVSAPGVGVQSTYNNGVYATLDGTSMATPHVSGVIALMRSYKPNATPDQILEALTATAENPETDGSNNRYGHGIVDAVAALDYLVGNSGGGSAPTPSPVDAGDNGGDSGPPPCRLVNMILRTDRFGYETSYSFTAPDGSTLWSAGRFSLRRNREYTESACIDPTRCYRFLIGDFFGDGITGEGLTLSYAGQTMYQGGNFGAGGYIDVGGGCS